MKKRTNKITALLLMSKLVLEFVLLMLLSGFMLVVSANELSITEETDELTAISTNADVFYYNDKMILDEIGENSVSGEIALASIGLAEAAYDQDRISSAIDQMGFSTLYTSDYYYKESVRDNNDVVAYSIAEKYVNYSGELYRIIIVPIRGTPETCEWCSNFNIGLDKTHKGFNNTAWKVLGKLSEYIYEPLYNVQHTVLWTTGHSRGAAVANIIAGEISTGNAFSDVITKDCVFGYTFACPSVSIEADTTLQNIYNFNNPGDIVPELPLSSWGFNRFGQTIEFPASDYDNLCQRYKMENGEDYEVGMTTVAWEAILKDIAPTREEFVGNDKIQLGVDILSYYLGGYTDLDYPLIDVVLSHPCADAEIISGVIKTTLFPKSTLEAMTTDITIAEFQIMLESDLQAYLNLETDLQTAIIDTAEMSDVDSEDEETHKKYLEWCSWKSDHTGLIYDVEDKTNIVIKSKTDLYSAYNAAGERYADYKDIVSTIRDVISLFYDTEGNMSAPFSQGHPQQTYMWWVNSLYFGYHGWWENTKITTVNWKGRNQKTYIGDHCFLRCDSLQKVSDVPDNILIGVGGFGDCDNLTDVEFTGQGITIGIDAFRNCDNLTEVDFLGEGITIGESAFEDCPSLKNLIIPDSLFIVSRKAFAHCGIEKLTAPDGFNDYYSYGDDVFLECPITDLTITKGYNGEYFENNYYYDFNYQEDWSTGNIVHVKIEEGVKSLGAEMFWRERYPSLREIELPSTLERVNTNAFSISTLEKVIYHGDIVSWCGIEFEHYWSNPLYEGDGELYVNNERVVTLVIPDNVEEIKKFAFAGYSGLKSVVFSNSVSDIGEAAFEKCMNLYSVKNNGAARIGDSAFHLCESLTEVDFLGEGITIGERAFGYNRSLKKLVIPDNVYSVGREAFAHCGIEKLTAPDGFNDYYSFGDDVFLECPITDLTITKGYNGEYFENNYYSDSHEYREEWSTDNIVHVKVEEGVKSLGADMFWGERYPSLREIELPSTLERVNTNAFCISTLEKVIYHGDMISWCGIEFEHYWSNPLYEGDGELYVNNERVVTLVIPDNAKEVKEYAFAGYRGLNSVKIPKSVSTIGSSAFYLCNGIKDVYYDGDKSEWEKITISVQNDPLLNATFHNSSHIHNLKKTESVMADCTSEGNIAYWTCDICGKYYSDDMTETEIEKDSWLIPPTGHSYGEWIIIKPATETETGLESRTCTKNPTHVETREIPKLVKIDITTAQVILSANSYTYSGSAKKPTVTVIIGTETLMSGTDYTVSYSNNTNVGTATVTVTGTGKYKGEKSSEFIISKAAPKLTFASSTISKTILDAAFTNTLTKTTDGAVTFKSSNTAVATVNSASGAVTIKGIGTAAITASATAGKNYKAGSASYTLTVVDGRTDISKCNLMLSATSYTYNGKAKKPTVTVKNGTQNLTSGTDYTVAYSNNTNAGTATVTVTGTGNCTGTNSATFKINKAASKLTFASESVSKEISDDAFINELTKTTDGTVTLSSSDTNVATVNSTTGIVTIRGTGTATITASASAGKNYKAGSASYTLDVSGISIENAAVGGVSLSYGYSGKAYTPAVTVKMDGVMLTKDTDYTVKYENNQNPGTATITVTGKGKYSGTKTKTFEIVDCVSSVVSGKTYLLIPKNNSKTAVCAYAGKMVNNTKIYITDRGNSESQKFKAVKNSDGTWKFINAKCELALAVQQNSSALGAGLALYDQTTKPAQNWKLSKKSDNSFAIINSVTGYSIAMSDKSAVKGTTLSMAETASVGLQRFYIVETSAVSAPFAGTNSIRAAKDQSFAVNIASSSKEDGANVSLYTYTNSNARKFKIIYSGGGYYRLVNVNSGLCLTIKDNSNADGANIIQSKWKGYSSQRWKITKNSDGTVTITNMLGTVLHLLGNRTVNNTNIHARKAASTTAQKWYLQ